MIDLRFRAAFAGSQFAHWSMISTFEVVARDGATWLYAGSGATGGFQRFSLAEGGAARWLDEVTLPAQSRGLSISDAEAISLAGQTRLLTASRSGAGIDMQTVAADGRLARAGILRDAEGPVAASAIATFSIGGTGFVAAGAWNDDRLRLFRIEDDWSLTAVSAERNSPKAALDGVSDLIAVQVGDRQFVVSTSAGDDGLSVFSVSAAGRTALVDTLGPKDGLWVAGTEQVAAVTAHGATWLVLASTLSSSLSVIRINDHGVLFVADQVHDTLTTRFHRASEVETFAVGGRAFVLAGGADGGLSLFELLPDGRLHHHRSFAQDDGWDLGGLTGLKAVQVGAAVQVFAAGASRPGIVQFDLDLSSLGVLRQGTAGADSLTGTPGDDILIGGRGNSTLSGGAGDDVLIAGPGANRLIGGPGADVFVLSASGAQQLIMDFEKGLDRLDLSGWGRIYDPSALTIRGRANGAEIIWQDEAVRVLSADGARIAPSAWTADDFIF
ncbi:MAG: calcium-binding protein [Gemmobacter sp.]